MNAAVVVAAVGLGVTIAGGILGVVYQLGRFAARIESLEAWRSQMPAELNAIHQAIRDTQNMIRGAHAV